MARLHYSVESIRALRAKLARGERDIGTVAECDRLLEAVEQDLADAAAVEEVEEVDDDNNPDTPPKKRSRKRA